MGQRSEREDATVRRSSPTCAVCQPSLRDGSQRDSLDVFICAQCQADAKQLFEIKTAFGPASAKQAGQSTSPTIRRLSDNATDLSAAYTAAAAVSA